MADSIYGEVRAVGGSMSPFILPGSTLSVERVCAASIRKGDVICFIGDNAEGITHRVSREPMGGSEAFLSTKGDAQRDDERVPQEAIVFVVRRVRHRFFSYNTGSLVGRVVARIALEEDLMSRALKAICWYTWRTTRLTRRAADVFRPHRKHRP